MSVVQLLQQLIAYVGVLLSQVGALYQSLIASNITIVIHDTAAETSQTLATVTDPTFGLASIEGQVVSMQAQLTTILTDVVALGSPQQSGVAVMLPTTPPLGYGGATASDVWSFVLASSGSQAGNALDNANGLAVALAEIAWPRLPGQPYLKLVVHFNWLGIGFITPNPLAPLDVATIIESDATPADWVQRAYTSYGWITLNQSAEWQPLAYPDQATSNVYWALDMSQAEFDQIKQSLFVIPGIIVAPIWPGIAGVTLGSAHTMVPPGEDITIDCDGVIIAVTGVPSWAGSFSFGTAISWRNVGAVTFTTDNGQQEFAQTFSWDSGVLMPKSQQHASGYAYRAAIGVSGTITPFTVN